jgi:hypothetical protein
MRHEKYYSHLYWISNAGRIIVVDEKESKALMGGCGKRATECGHKCCGASTCRRSECAVRWQIWE